MPARTCTLTVLVPTTRLLLQSKRHSKRTWQPEEVASNREPPSNDALACLVGIAVLRIGRHRAVTPIPFDRRAIEVRKVVLAIAHFDDESRLERRETNRRRDLE